jgi:hypothetical protein
MVSGRLGLDMFRLSLDKPNLAHFVSHLYALNLWSQKCLEYSTTMFFPFTNDRSS